MTVTLVAPPAGYPTTLGELPAGARLAMDLRPGRTFVHLFARDREELGEGLPRARDALARDGTLWVSWPKKASGVPTDLDGNVVRSAGIDAGLVDVKVCAVDAVWSGLNFVYRKADR